MDPFLSYRQTIYVTYCNTDGDGFAVRDDYVVQAPFNQPLLLTLQEVLPADLQHSLLEGNLQCYEGHVKV